jgi:hypothetical protein
MTQPQTIPTASVSSTDNAADSWHEPDDVANHIRDPTMDGVQLESANFKF